ncbi:MAG TPA: hypothetical protein VHC19_09505, partial [Pirellulales bacterium]|nr:hypothetical protein [Pirellulales bacterium]
TDAPPDAGYCPLQPGAGPRPGSGEFRYRMRCVGDALRAAGVGAVYLMQGTFAALDSHGMLAELARQYPDAKAAIDRLATQIIDPAAGDAGNFTARYADVFQSQLATGGEEIPVRLLHWSGENHHLGRADAAVRLIDEIASLELPAGKRILLWGHCHAGNVFALASNLLSGDVEAIEQFFAAARIYYRLPLTGIVDIPVWQRVHNVLTKDPRRLAGRRLDFVTFGTPIRYGWDRRGYDGLLHFVNHRPADGCPLYRTPFPPSLDDVLRAAGGDYMQQVGIAGADTSPSRLAWRAWLANRRLTGLFEQNLATDGLLNRLTRGMRVPEAGDTLLVDYGLPQESLAQHLAGHAVYTRKEWLLFHAEQVAERLYQSVFRAGAA